MPSETEFTNSVAAAMKKDGNKKAPQPVMVATPEQLKKARASTGAPASEMVKAEPKSYPPLDAPANWKEPPSP